MEHTLHSAYARAVAAEKAARRNHYQGEITPESFWGKAAASLPPHVQRRYGHLFEAAERYEPVIEYIVDLLRSGRPDQATAKRRGHRQVRA